MDTTSIIAVLQPRKRFSEALIQRTGQLIVFVIVVNCFFEFLIHSVDIQYTSVLYMVKIQLLNFVITGLRERHQCYSQIYIFISGV